MPKFTLRPVSIVLSLLVALAAASTAAPSPAPATRSPAKAETYVLQDAVRLSVPPRPWLLEVDPKDPAAVSVVNKDAGLQIVLRWVPNKAQLESRRAAAVLESKLMRADNSAGRQFSFLKSRPLGGLQGASFTVEHLVERVGTYRTQYVVVTNGENCLVVAVSGGVPWLDKHKKEVERLLDTITFLHPRPTS